MEKSETELITDYSRVLNVVFIPIAELVVDRCNIRGGEWDYDKDLIRSVKRAGIQQPLIVRPLDSAFHIDGKKWGIVAGSRRYNAALEAELEVLPCRIMVLDDIKAMLYSMEENRNRKPTAKWRDIEYVGEVTSRLVERDKSKSEAFRIIGDTIGMSLPTIKRYNIISTLPSLFKALLREPEELRSEQRDFIRLVSPAQKPGIPISLETAELIAKYLPDLEILLQARIALDLDPFPNIHKETILKEIAHDPNLTVDEIVGNSISRGKESRHIVFERKILDSLADACLERQTTLQELIKRIMTSWLREERYME